MHVRRLFIVGFFKKEALLNLILPLLVIMIGICALLLIIYLK
jgi:hypothetical protein